VSLLAVLMSTVLAAVPAAAYWTASGSGGASAATSTLAPPTDLTVPASVISDVDISWTPGTGGVVPQGYVVTRYAADASPAPACGTSPAQPGPAQLVTGTTCTDEDVPNGQHTYVVTAVYNTWTAASLPSGAVEVTNATQLGFVGQPSDTLTTTPITPPVTVALQAGDGSTVAAEGVPVTVSVTPSVNSIPVPLSGTPTVQTGGDGIAVFDDLAIQPPGSYTLTATGPGLTEAVSEPFTVLPPPLLDDAARFSVLGRTGVVSTGATRVSGDVGVSQGSTVTGFPPGVVAGDIHVGDAAEESAQADLDQTHTQLTALEPTNDYPGGDLGGFTLTPGVYYTGAALAVTGEVTLDGEGDPNAVFVLQVGAALNTAAASLVTLTNGAQAANVYWVALGAVGTGADSSFSGQILTRGAITLGARSTLIGRALSRGTVTLGANVIRFTQALPPSITIDGGATAVTKDTTPTITGTTSAAIGRTVTVSVATQSLTTTVGSGGIWSVTAASLVAGEYQVVAKVRDAAGNAATAAQTLTVEVNPDPVVLGTAGAYSVLAVTSVVNTGATTLSGDLGVSPGGSVSGFPPGTVSGEVHLGDTAAVAAQTDLLTAIGDASGRAPHSELSGDLGGRTFHAGVRHSTTALALTGTVTLDGENDPDAVFIFQADAAFDTAASSVVNLVNGAQAGNVFWVVQGAAGTGASTLFAGTIMARGAVSLGAGTELIGRALSRGSVTMAGNPIRFTVALPPTITINGDAAATTQDATPTISGTTTVASGRPVTVTVAGQALTTTVQPGGVWSVTATTLAAGAHPVVAKAKDAAGNGATTTQSLTVEVSPDPVALGTAAGFSVLAGTAVANSGPTDVSSDVGVSPGGVVGGFPPGIIGGQLHVNDDAAVSAQNALLAAITDASGRTAHTEVTGDLGGRTFGVGVHHSTAALALTGTVTLDGRGDPNAVFIFQGDAALNTAAGGTVVLTNGAQASNVFWVVDGAVGTGANTSFAGTILSSGAVTFGDGTSLVGRVLSRDGVTLANNTISDTP
jgi:hypothetical protein